MGGAVEVFDFEENAVRVVMVESDPWWVAADLARALEYRDSHDMIRMLDDDQKRMHDAGREFPALNAGNSKGGRPASTIVNESGMWTCVLRSDKPAAKRFRRWLTDEVLPALRRTGRFDMGATSAGERPQLSIEAITRITDSVTKVNRIGGKAAAMRLWDALGGPPIFDPVDSSDGRPSSGSGREADVDVQRWFDERVEPHPGRQIETGVLFDDYLCWCGREGIDSKVLASFGRHLSRIAGKSKKSGRCQRVGLGIKVEQGI